MNKNVAALLRVDHAQLTNFRPIVPGNMQQSSITDLPAHLRVEGRPIENDVHFAGLFAGQDPVDNRFRFEKIVPEEFRRVDSELAFFNTDFFFLLGLACAVALFLHQLLKAGDIDRERALARHEFGEIKRKAIGIVELERRTSWELWKWNVE